MRLNQHFLSLACELLILGPPPVIRKNSVFDGFGRLFFALTGSAIIVSSAWNAAGLDVRVRSGDGAGDRLGFPLSWISLLQSLLVGIDKTWYGRMRNGL